MSLHADGPLATYPRVVCKKIAVTAVTPVTTRMNTGDFCYRLLPLLPFVQPFPHPSPLFAKKPRRMEHPAQELSGMECQDQEAIVDDS